MFSTVAFSLENIEKYRNQFSSDIEANILPAIKYYPTKIEELKENLEELNKFATDINKKTNTLTAAKQTGEMNKINQITVLSL